MLGRFPQLIATASSQDASTHGNQTYLSVCALFTLSAAQIRYTNMEK